MGTKYFNITLLLSYGRTANRMIQRTLINTESKKYWKVLLIQPGIPEWGIRSTFGYRLIKFIILTIDKLLPALVKHISTRQNGINSKRRPITIVSDTGLQIESLKDSRNWATEKFLDSKHFICSCALAGKTRSTEGYLVAHVRLGDIWNQETFKRRDYLPLPISYYRSLSRMWGRPIAFLLEDQHDSSYARALTANCPGSIILESGCLYCDFKTLSESKMVAVATSTFSWFATWISTNTEKIFIPIYGFFDEIIRPDINLIDWRDPRNIIVRFDYPEFSNDKDYVSWLMGSQELMLNTSQPPFNSEK